MTRLLAFAAGIGVGALAAMPIIRDRIRDDEWSTGWAAGWRAHARSILPGARPPRIPAGVPFLALRIDNHFDDN